MDAKDLDKVFNFATGRAIPMRASLAEHDPDTFVLVKGEDGKDVAIHQVAAKIEKMVRERELKSGP